MITATTSPLSVRGSRTIASSSSRHCQLEPLRRRSETLDAAVRYPRFLVPARDYQPRGLALLPLRLALPKRRRHATRRHRLVRIVLDGNDQVTRLVLEQTESE